MKSRLRCASRLAVFAIAFAAGVTVLAKLPANAGDPGVSPGFFQRGITASGTLSYGGYGVYPGYPGFGLSFHVGYGYGGSGLGTGGLGGYPFYGGPGYPHPAPALRRCGGIAPFPFYGGPEYPRSGLSNYFTEVGPLMIHEPVAVITPPNAFGYSGDFGPFTGTLPYPDGYFAPFTQAAANGRPTEGPRSNDWP
jgi:hypothetical protein